MKKYNAVDGYTLSNRQKNQMPRRHTSWCPCCDRDMLPAGGKCATCGYKDPSKVFKK